MKSALLIALGYVLVQSLLCYLTTYSVGFTLITAAFASAGLLVGYLFQAWRVRSPDSAAPINPRRQRGSRSLKSLTEHPWQALSADARKAERDKEQVRKRWDEAGFTVLELLIVVGIIAILVALASWGAQRVLDNGDRHHHSGQLSGCQC